MLHHHRTHKITRVQVLDLLFYNVLRVISTIIWSDEHLETYTAKQRWNLESICLKINMQYRRCYRTCTKLEIQVVQLLYRERIMTREHVRHIKSSNTYPTGWVIKSSPFVAWKCIIRQVQKWWCFRPLLCTLFRLNWAKQTPGIMRRKLQMTKLAPEWVRTSDPVIRSPARYRWTTAPYTASTSIYRFTSYCREKMHLVCSSVLHN